MLRQKALNLIYLMPVMHYITPLDNIGINRLICASEKNIHSMQMLASLEGHTVTNSPTWKEFEWKVKMRFFRTLLVSSKFGGTSGHCWRGCGLVGDHTRIFWDCPKSSRYWQDIQKEIKKCLNIEVPLEPSYFLIGILPDNLENNSQTLLLRNLLLVAKKMITVSWLKPQPPIVTQWREKIRDVYYMENITARLQLKTEVFLSKWSPIISFLSL